jgi:hypothetical protein
MESRDIEAEASASADALLLYSPGMSDLSDLYV